MKKLLGPMLGLMLVPSLAFGQILNTAHDFVNGTDPWDGAGNLCGTCHSPHTPVPGGGVVAPLWTHATSTVGAGYQVYSSSSLDNSASTPSGVTLACLSCHDGTVAVRGGASITSGGALVGTDLRGDHPVSIPFAGDPNMNTVATATGGGVSLYGTAGSETVECGSCHDPHLNAFRFLRPTTGDLCTTCHNR